MKIALILAAVCLAVVFSGCSTYQGGTADENGISSGSASPMEPIMGEPSLPQDPAANTGPAIPPP